MKVENLQVGVEDKAILDRLSLTIRNGETHVLMGPNGVGESTPGYAIVGHPQYNICQGSIVFNGDDIANESTDVRVKKEVLLSFQSPEEVPGIALGNFLHVSCEAVTDETPRILKFQKGMGGLMDLLEISQDCTVRYLDVGFPGGERKESEILQVLVLNPKLAALDETDSGLGMDAVEVISKGIRQFYNDKNSLLIIAHNAKTLDGLKVDCVHILVNGMIVHTGDSSLIRGINKKGFQFFEAGGARS